MILKKILGKTVEAAKKSAQQIYGDDFVVWGSSLPDDTAEAGITVAIDEKKSNKADSLPKKRKQSGAESGKQGISHKYLNRMNGAGKHKNIVSPNLMALRQYAEKQKFPVNGNTGNNRQSDVQHYSRASIRTTGKITEPDETTKKESVHSRNGDKETAFERSDPHFGMRNRHDLKEKETRPAGDSNGLLSQFDQSSPKIKYTSPSPAPSSSRREQREITALHKRFDKLEALLDSALISSNINYVSHPAFQQLVHTGISTSVVAGWFSKIVREGTDPYDQTELFMSKLSAIIRNAIVSSAPEEIKKYLLFTGPSGSGKTEMIMKLIMHPEFLQGKKTCVVALLRRDEQSQHYFTILEPFCKKHDIAYFPVKSGDEVTALQRQWEDFDHILIDTPSISMQQEHSFRQYWKIRQVFASLTPLEVHYVVNASLNRFYFKNSSTTHHPLHPDYVAITHLDEVSQWGPLIPFLEEMGCSARYISSGDSIPDSLSEFNPTWFAQNVLQNR